MANGAFQIAPFEDTLPPWDMKQDNPYLLAQLGFEPTPSLGVSFHIKKDLNAKATEPRRLHRKV